MHRPLRSLALAFVLQATSSAAQSPPSVCTLDEADVAFANPLPLLFALPPVGAFAEYPIAEVLRAARVRVDVPVGEGESFGVSVAVETAAVRLHGAVRAEALALFPARPLRFGGLLIPLAHHALRLHGASPEGLRLTVPPAPRVRHDLRPELHPCAGVRLRPSAAFDRAALLTGATARRVPTPRGVWSFYRSPGASGGPRVQVQAAPSDTVWQVESGPAPWRRVLWITTDIALFGWTRPPHAPQSFGGGTGRGVIGAFSGSLHTVACRHDLTLFADDRGTLHEVGVVKAGAALSLAPATGERTRVQVHDRDLRWADGVTLSVPTAQLAGCGAR